MASVQLSLHELTYRYRSTYCMGDVLSPSSCGQRAPSNYKGGVDSGGTGVLADMKLATVKDHIIKTSTKIYEDRHERKEEKGITKQKME